MRLGRVDAPGAKLKSKDRRVRRSERKKIKKIVKKKGQKGQKGTIYIKKLKLARKYFTPVAIRDFV